ncbi:hypothetical protein B2E24_003796 [Salmonella enterica]|uniref:hypothetical protein n=1 Tax=Salmonella enterica TaxID=28901 RepID=UPI0009ACE07B|nr:hypothetical protein [Salmonella enterica]EDV8696823.1 hypothetical protein [Salmonella enterica]EFV1621009.1 hypothetical protein [Salmonella enterica]
MDVLTFYEFVVINHRLRMISETWADLWISLHYLPVSVGRLVWLRYTDITDTHIIFPGKGRYKEVSLLIPAPVSEVIHRRKATWPDDIYIFQSHSNRVKSRRLPVTVIAFNRALKQAAVGLTRKNITSKCA